MVAILGSGLHTSIWDFMAQTHVKNRTQLSSQSLYDYGVSEIIIHDISFVNSLFHRFTKRHFVK